MPNAPKRPCAQIGCSALVDIGYCPAHKAARPPPGMVRTNPYRSMYNRRWERLRIVFLKDHPLCEHCNDAGIITPSKEVDHKIPHKGDLALFWDQNNWQGLCKPCHSSKTAKYDR